MMDRREFIRNTFLGYVGLKLGVPKINLDTTEKFFHTGQYTPEAFEFFRQFAKTEEQRDPSMRAQRYVSTIRVYVGHRVEMLGKVIDPGESAELGFSTMISDYALADDKAKAFLKINADAHREGILKAMPRGWYEKRAGQCLYI